MQDIINHVEEMSALFALARARHREAARLLDVLESPASTPDERHAAGVALAALRISGPSNGRMT